jgi:hypothetical protein
MNTDSGFAMACFLLIQVDAIRAHATHAASPTPQGVGKVFRVR